MLTLSFQSTFLAALQILLMAGVGYFLMKRRLIDERGLALLSRLVINLFLPCLIFHQLTQNFSFQLYPHWWQFPVLSVCITLGAYLLSQVVVWSYRKMTYKKAFKALITFQNAGYIPLILVASLFSAEQSKMLFVYIFLFTIGFDLMLWSLGVWLLTRHTMERFEFKNLFHPPAVTILVSLGLIALGFHKFVPAFILKPVEMFGNCAIPLSMIVVGGNLACLKVSDINFREISLVVATKLILFPLLALMILVLKPVDYWMGFLILLETAAPSSVSLSVISRHYQVEESFISQGLVFTHAACVVTIPIFLIVYGKLFSG